MTFTGEGVHQLEAERGAHRVQRVPPNERQGRVHSSTATVAVFDPQRPAEAGPEALRRPQDFSLEWYSGSGAGGQHRNKHMNSARITHLPTGLVRTAQTRSRANSQKEAMAALTAALDAQQQARAQGDHLADLQAQVGTGQRADRRRVWAFQRDEVMDHTTGKRLRCKDALAGQLHRLW